MASLEQYLYDMEAVPDVASTGEGLIVLPMAASTTGTCGVTTPEAGLPLPLPHCTATGGWSPLGLALLPTPATTGNLDGWHPAWGNVPLPLPEITGKASFALCAALALPPLFTEARTGARGVCRLPGGAVVAGFGAMASLELPVPSPYGLSGLDRTADLAIALPRALATAWSCSLDDPLTNAADADTVVALLCQGNSELALAATSLAGGANLATLGADGLAGTLLAAVADNLTYAADAGEVWTCAMGTYTRGAGDCEDGAMLLHALLLAAGLPADRLVTVFGRVGVNRLGHAWVTYRRESDGNWVVLDWTAATPATSVACLPPIESAPYYALVDYALTATTFFAVRQRAATFFPRAGAMPLLLPGMTVTAMAALGATMTCVLDSGWLRASALAAATASARLFRPKLTARAGGNHAQPSLPAPTVTGHTASVAAVSPKAPTASGEALGAWGKAGCALRTTLAGQGTSTLWGRGQTILSRTAAAATGLCGLRATGRFDCPRSHLLAHGWPGGLAHGQTTLAFFGLHGLGLATDPGHGAAALAGLVAQGLAESDPISRYHWQTTPREGWS